MVLFFWLFPAANMKLVVRRSGQYGGGDVRGAPFKRSPPNKARIGDKDGKTLDSRFFELQFLLV